MLTFARHQPLRAVGVATVVALPLMLLFLSQLPASFAVLAVFACFYGATNGIMTIIRSVAVPEMLTPQAYGAINGFIGTPATVLGALAPVGAAMLWSVTGPYDAVLGVAVAAGIVVTIAFSYAAFRSAVKPVV